MASGAVDQLFALFDRYGAVHYGENVSQRQHALQAAELARIDGASDALIAAALLHDIGQFVDGAGDAAESERRDGRHEMLGASLLERLFPRSVTEPVRLHVDAKRYLCAVRPGFTESLTDASKLSLRLQGGPMDAEQVARFEANPFFADAVRLRGYDDGGKRDGWAVPALESYRSLLERLLV